MFRAKLSYYRSVGTKEESEVMYASTQVLRQPASDRG